VFTVVNASRTIVSSTRLVYREVMEYHNVEIEQLPPEHIWRVPEEA